MTSPEVHHEDDNKVVKLKRNVGLLSAVGMIVGTMIGSGIFISPKGVLEGAGSVGLSLIVWALSGTLATLGALVYAELGTAIPLSGSEHAYFMYAYARGKSTVGRCIPFLYDWVGLFIIRPVMFSVICLAFGTYVVKPFYPGCDPPPFVVKMFTIVAMLTIAFINSFSVKLATTIQNIMMVIKLIALAIISIGGIFMMSFGHVDVLSEGFQYTSSSPSTIAIAFYNGLWSYDGWNNLNFITEELKNPNRNLPLSIIVGIPLTTALYVLANVGYMSVMTKEEIILSHAVAVTWGDRVLGVMSWIIPFSVAASTFGAANGVLFASGRLCYVAARDHHFPQFLSFIHFKRLTPVPAMMFTCLVSILMIIPGDITTLIDFFGFSSWLVYGFTTFTLLLLRVKEKDLKRPYRVPTVIPVIVLLMACYLVLGPIIQDPKIQFLYAILFILSGIIVYVPFVYLKIHPPGLDKLTEASQKFLQIVPSKVD